MDIREIAVGQTVTYFGEPVGMHLVEGTIVVPSPQVAHRLRAAQVAAATRNA